MKVQPFENMQIQYEADKYGLQPDDLERRKQLLETHRHSVIIEGFHEEFDNLDLWIAANLAGAKAGIIYYGKINYDYGFAEYFVTTQAQRTLLSDVVPRIFTTYPDADPPGLILRSDGYEGREEYDEGMSGGIVFP